MNSTDSNSGGFLGSENFSGFGFGVSVGILFLVTTIILTCYLCTRSVFPPAHPGRPHRPNPHNGRLEPALGLDMSVVTIEAGIDEAALLSYPKILYSEAKNQNKVDSTAICCSICLADYKNSDMLRLLPDCGHLFHLKCVDPWLRLHPTCPVCRTSPMPTPLPTPLAEVTPLAI